MARYIKRVAPETSKHRNFNPFKSVCHQQELGVWVQLCWETHNLDVQTSDELHTGSQHLSSCTGLRGGICSAPRKSLAAYTLEAKANFFSESSSVEIPFTKAP